MAENKERKTKDLIDEVDKPVEPKPEVKNDAGENNSVNNNSFYDRKETNVKTAWYKDWRGKTLGLSLSALILIGAGIPAGIAIMGGFSHNEINYGEQFTEEDYANARNELEIISDDAIIYQYESLVYEGYVSEKVYENNVEDAEDAADDTIKNSQDALKKGEYGNTWEEEWDNQLQEMGYHTGDEGTEEYRNSLISATISAKVSSEYTTYNALIKQLNSTSDDAVYGSGKNSKGEYLYVDNHTPYYWENGETTNISENDSNITTTSFTSQDLMTMFLWAYEPILFNDTLLPFTLVDGTSGTEGTLEGNNILMTTTNITNIKYFWQLLEEGFEPEATNAGGLGIQSKNNFNLSSTEGTLAVKFAMAQDGTIPAGELNTTKFKTAINNAFDVALDSTFATSSEITSYQIENMTNDQIDLFESEFKGSLISWGLLDDETNKRNITTTTTFTTNYEDGEEEDYVSYLSTDGVHSVGIQSEGNQMLTEYLNASNDVSDIYVPSVIEDSFLSTYTSWLSSAFDKILIISYLTNPNDESGWFTYDGEQNPTLNISWDSNNVPDFQSNEWFEGMSEEQIIDLMFSVMFGDLWINLQSNVVSSYQAADTFYNDTYSIQYGTDAFSLNSTAYLTFLESGNLYTLINNYVDGVFSSSESEVILIKGEDE